MMNHEQNPDVGLNTKHIGCPLGKDKCCYVTPVSNSPSRCLLYDDANLCSKANKHKKKVKKHQKEMLSKSRNIWRS